MHVSSEFRQRDTPDVASNPAAYAWAGSASSFITVLHEINTPRRDDAPDSTRPAEDDTVASTDTKTSEKAGSEDSVSDAEPAPSSADKTAGDSDATTTTDNADTSNTETPDDATDTTAVPEAPMEEAGSEGVAVRADGNPEPTTPPAAPSDDATHSPSPTPVDTEVDIAAPLTLANRPSADTQTQQAVVSADGDGAVDTDGEDSAPKNGAADRSNAFPKSLNALLAENAVRGTTNNESTPEFSRFQMVSEEKATVPMESADADGLTEQRVALPHAPAMETAGVRTDAPAGPRIPLANLPGELAQQIHLMQQEGTKTMRIRLVPENLGEIRIEIRGHGDTMRVHMTSANPAVRDALDSQMGELRQALQKQGLDLANVTVDAGTGQRDTPHGREGASTPSTHAPADRPAPDSRNTTTAPAEIITANGSLNVLA